MDAAPLPSLPLPVNPFVLTHLDVYDWGAFSGRHCAEIDIQGTAIIGPTGSGKTTLVDALMTLLTASPRYNLASTGGHESDRDLVSYIRGVSGAGNNSGDNEHIARSGKTVTGIAARFSDGDNPLTIGAIFWLDGSSSASADLKRMWIFSQAPEQTLDNWLQVHEAGGVRALKQLEKEIPGLRMFNSKQAYLAQLRTFFEVGENAFTLLNRAAGMKQIDSIDEVFREFVLDDTSAFEKAAAVAKQFDDLAEIHKELEVARQQRASLLPVAESWKARTDLQAKEIVHRQLDALIVPWYASHASRLWGERVIQLDEKIEHEGAQLEQVRTRLAVADQHATILRDIYLKAGGASVDQLREQISKQQALIDGLDRHVADYRRLTGTLELNNALTHDALLKNQQAAREQTQVEEQALPLRKQQVYGAGATRQGHQQARDEIQQKREQVRARPGSNLDPAYLLFRSALAQQLELAEDQLPFVAELVEVKPEHARWRGAIERAIGGQRLRVMVPAAAMDNALAWINQRHNQLHVRLLEVHPPAHTAEFFADGYTRKLNYKPNPYREALKKLLAEHDLHCVDTPERLRSTPHGLTEQGLMSGRERYFDKHDQRRLDQGWMTGFDNKDRLAELEGQWLEADKLVREADATHRAAVDEVERAERRLHLWQSLLQLRFEEIDMPGAGSELKSLELRLEALTAPDSDAFKAEAHWRAADAQLRELREQEKQDGIKKGLLEGERKGAERQRQRAVDRLSRPLDDEQCALAAEHLGSPDPERLDEFSEMERIANEAQRKRLELLSGQLKKCEQDLVRQMGTAQKLDTGALSEVGTDMDDVPSYIERLRVLTNEALPEKQQRFLDYLNQSSDQGVTQLLSEIDNEVAMIEERIDDLNSTLRRVDFKPGCYLSLQPQRVVHESLRNLTHAQRHLLSARLKDDQGESHFSALQHMVGLLREAADRRRTLPARALLDPRYRLTFAVLVIARGTGAVIEIRTGSQGGSGGEKEIIASYVLTASLSYALCPESSHMPLFGTIVLDEAFSKSSQAVAGRIISALTEFGLHPLFVTPNKELLLLRRHTRSAILIHRRGQRATLTSLSWEELDTYARQRDA
jgi:uncharacterized protein YPO0396